ncbi:MAG TPA: hypothetical protein VGM63_10065, partial [Mucilaginibacter sp.]
MKKKIICMALVLFSGALVLNSCGGNKSSNNAMNPTSNGSTPVIAATATIQNFAFSPSVIHVLPGGT